MAAKVDDGKSQQYKQVFHMNAYNRSVPTGKIISKDAIHSNNPPISLFDPHGTLPTSKILKNPFKPSDLIVVPQNTPFFATLDYLKTRFAHTRYFQSVEAAIVLGGFKLGDHYGGIPTISYEDDMDEVISILVTEKLLVANEKPIEYLSDELIAIYVDAYDTLKHKLITSPIPEPVVF